VVVILEDNGWESQRLVNHLVSTVLQEALGYRVAYLRNIGVSESAQRVGLGTSHAVLEYWYDTLPNPAVYDTRVPPPYVQHSQRGLTIFFYKYFTHTQLHNGSRVDQSVRNAYVNFEKYS